MEINFKPKKTTLARIEATNQFPTVISIPSFPLEGKESVVPHERFFGQLKGMFTGNYRSFFMKSDIQHFLNDIVWEMVKNSIEHAHKHDTQKYVTIAFWFGNKGVLFALKDEGSFYGVPSVKEKIENRQKIESTRLNDPGGDGIDEMYQWADEIFVDVEEKALYISYILKEKNK